MRVNHAPLASGSSAARARPAAGHPGPGGGWSEFETKPTLYAVGNNLISVRFTQPQARAGDHVSIEKVEVHVAYK